ncbi:germination protein YpeB [Clostridium tagluense]|uniref:germination protein YpeB n=1 Tax=Clostridium tagluense TaxID=360422 RepID=UPI001C0ACEFE|nr:germination protein YpeB [Clostridium tagluense]MBU3127388.1 germination protein YpeB [Clostridium tagluense]MCB2311138.1 germination protein YpeB [Clostridium tagluense]MCB2315862.1 germination protein YpeB [Clostridium tagluense]MCB2320791.1 germination protein YpeB [Clostridium tagluense]MCB2325808.1 germination protein YpeB [Clostridium tagluense]
MKMLKKRILYTSAVTIIVVFSTTFAILMFLERLDYRNYLQGQYSKNMYELISSVQNIRVNLGKAAIVGSREQSIVVFEEIFRHSDTANDKLHSLPIEQSVVGDTSKFLTQVGDFCYSLAKATSEGKDLSAKQYELIDQLEMQSYTLQEQLNSVLSDINEGKVKWGEIRKKSTSVFAKVGDDLVNEKFKGIQKQVVQYPALIYDGPFSDNTLEIKPKIISQKEVSQSDAVKTIKNIFGEDKIESIENKQVQGKTKIPSYTFHVTFKGRAKGEPKTVIEVSKNGSRILYLLDNRSIEKATIDIKKAIKGGSEFIGKIGYKNMEPTYTLNYENTAVVSYVYKQGEVAIYPDQVKLKIALDDGSIIGIESEKFLVSHVEKRQINVPKITAVKAQERVGKRLKISKISLAIIPTEMNKEVLCYEFLGSYKEKNFIVYINADTGYEQRIMEIIDTPNGKLTI